MRKPIRKADTKRAPKRRLWIYALIAGVAVFGCGILLRHELPTVLALIDGGPEQIPATSLAERIQRASRAPTEANPSKDQAAASFEATAEFPVLNTTQDGVHHITVAGWNFNGPDLVAMKAPDKAWRTSFGSERVAQDVRRTATGFQADIIAVFGIDTFATVRTAIPAQDYFLISPPQLRNMALAQARTAQPFPTPAVAIALRRDARLRAGHRVQMVFGDRLAGNEIEAALRPTPSDLQAAAETQTLPFAIEVTVGGSRVWVLAMAFGTEMTARVAAWIAKRRNEGQAVIVLGAGQPAGLTAPAGTADYAFGNGTGAAITARDAGCTVPDVSLHAWRADNDETLLRRLDPIWRTRPSGGDCVLIARLPVAKAPEQPLQIEPLFAGEPEALEQGPDGDFGIAVRPEAIVRPDPIRLD